MKLKLIFTSILISFTSLTYASQVIDQSGNIEASRLSASNVAQLEEVKEQLKRMRGDIEQLQFDGSRLNEKLVKLASDMEFRFSQLDKKKNEVSAEQKILDNIDANLDNNSILQQSDATKASAKPVDDGKALPADIAKDKVLSRSIKQRSMEQEYQDAYSMLKERDYVKSRAMFQKFLEKYPDSELAGSARYWNGETYFAQEDYDKAAVEYLKGYQANIRGSRAPDNLLKLAKSLSKLDKRQEEACITLMKLKKEFPNAQNTIKKQMMEDIKALKCKL